MNIVAPPDRDILSGGAFVSYCAMRHMLEYKPYKSNGVMSIGE